MHVRPIDGRAAESDDCSNSTASCSPTSVARTTRSRPATSAAALVDFARAERATQLVLGASRRSRWSDAAPRIGHHEGLAACSTDIDVHVIATQETEQPPGARRCARHRGTAIPRRRQVLALLLAIVALPLLTVVLDALGAELGLPSVLLIYLLWSSWSQRWAVSCLRSSPRSWRSCSRTGSSPTVHTFTIAERRQPDRAGRLRGRRRGRGQPRESRGAAQAPRRAGAGRSRDAGAPQWRRCSASTIRYRG